MLASPHISKPQGLHARHGQGLLTFAEFKALTTANLRSAVDPDTAAFFARLRFARPVNVERSQPDAREDSR